MATLTVTEVRGGRGIKSHNLSGKSGVLKKCAVHPTAFDLSGSAQTEAILCSPTALTIHSASFYYSEASSADAGVEVSLGTPADVDAYAEATSEVSQSIGDTTALTILDGTVPANTPVVAYNTGGKTGTGAGYLYVEYTIDDE